MYCTVINIVLCITSDVNNDNSIESNDDMTTQAIGITFCGMLALTVYDKNHDTGKWDIQLPIHYNSGLTVL